MSLGVGLIGLPNVGKSTMFNALTRSQQANAANYPFCTIEPNVAIVPVPDSRLDKLTEIIQPPQTIASTIEFYDIAGLVKGAHKGEGLGNQFLAAIRETDVLVHVVRCFEDENIAHVTGTPDPVSDIEIIQTELMLADMQILERRLEKFDKEIRGDRSFIPLKDVAQSLFDHISKGEPVSSFKFGDEDKFKILNHELRFLSGKPVIYAVNVSEKALGGENPAEAKSIKTVQAIAEQQNAKCVLLCAKLEEELAGLSPEERNEFLESMGIRESGLEQVVRMGYSSLGLISYFSHNEKELHSWTIRNGWKAPQAAGVIHSDFQEKFIRAEVISYDDFVQYKKESDARNAGHLRIEGKEYVVHDGDVIRFKI